MYAFPVVEFDVAPGQNFAGHPRTLISSNIEEVFAPREAKFSEVAPENAKFLAGAAVTSKAVTALDKAKSITGLRARVALVDFQAGLKKALELAKAKGRDIDLVQIFHTLMQNANAKNLTAWRVEQGSLDLLDVDDAGVKRQKVVGKEGVSLRSVAEALRGVEGWGSWESVSEAFQRLNMGLLARTRGEDVVFGKDIDEKTKAAIRAMASQYLAAPEKSPFHEAMKAYREYNLADIKFLRDTGQLTDAEFTDLAKHNYTPLFRADGSKYVMDTGTRKITVMQMKSPMEIKRLLGGNAPVMNWFAAARMNTEYLTKLGLQNHAAYASAKALESVGLAKKIVGTGSNTPGSDRSDVMTVRNKGAIERYIINSEEFGIPTDLVAKAFDGVPAGLPFAVRALGMASKVMRYGVTANPVYLGKQLIRDPVSAWGITGAKLNPITDTIRGISDAVQGKLDDTLKKVGVTGAGMFADSEYGATHELKEIVTGRKGFKTMLRVADVLAHEADAITRVNVMRGAQAVGATPMQSELAAWESMPFTKRGASMSMQYAMVMVPFLNATIQGLDALYRSAKGDMPLKDKVNVRAKLLQRGALIAGMTLAYLAMVSDDDGYKKLSDQERISNWYIPGMDLKVPVPFEFGFIAKALPEMIVRYMSGTTEGEEALRNLFTGLRALTPGMMPQGAKQAFEVVSNYSFYYDGPIESPGDEKKLIDARRRVDTPTLAKALSFSFEVNGTEYGLSERKAQYLADSLLPNVLPALSALIDVFLPTPDNQRPEKPATDLPYVSQMFTREANQGEVNRFYDEAERLAKYINTLNFYRTSSPEKAQAFFEENKLNVMRGQAAAKMRAQMDKVAHQINLIRENPEISAADKRTQIVALKELKTQYAQQFRTALREMKTAWALVE